MALISFLSSWLRPQSLRQRTFSRSRVSQAKRRVCSRPGVEALEDRLPPGDLSGTLGMSPLTDLSDHLALGPTSEEFSSGESVEVAPEWMDLLTVTESAWDLDYTFDDPVEEPAAVLDESETPVEEAPTAEPSLEEVVNTLTDDFLDDPLGTPETTNEETPVTSESPTGPGSTSIPTTGDASSPGGPQPGTMEDGGPTGPTAPTNAPGEDEQTMAQMTTDGQDPGVSPPADDAGDPQQSPAIDPSSTPNFTVTLEAPEFTNVAYPSAQIRVTGSADQPGVVPFQIAYVDVDLNHNGSFDEAGEAGFGNAWAGDILNTPSSVTFLSPLSEGTYQLRARLVAVDGNEWVSPTVSTQVDPQAGYLGSDALRRLYSDYVQVTTGSIDPFWSQPYWGDTTQHPEYQAKQSPLPRFDRGLTTLDQFQTKLRRDFVTDAAGNVLVNVRATQARHLPDLQNSLQALGMSVTGVTPAQNLITGYLPIAQLPQAIIQPHYASITPVYPAIRKTGSITSEGDAVILGPTYRNNTGATGAGVTVGVISDSANRVGGGLAASQASGDLSSNVNIIVDGANPSFDTDEGRAMMEIVQDVAPGTNLTFFSGDGGPQAMATGVQQLAGLGAQVIVDDLLYPNQPFFNDGVVAQAIDQVVSRQNVAYVSATGNDGDDGWMAPYRPVDTGTMLGFAHDFGGGDFQQDFTLLVGETMVLSFQYDSAFLEGGSPLPNFQVNTDMDVYITNTAFTMIFDSFVDSNDVTDEAFEFVTFTNDGSFGTNNFSMVFNQFSTAAPTMLRWVAFTSAFDNPNAQGQGGPTIFGNPAARGAISVGAIDWTTPTVPQSTTDLGGQLPFLFDSLGNRLATPDLRFKPEVGGPDNVLTSFFPAVGTPFTGTSAAAPHVAGAVALLREMAPTATPAQILQHLQTTALNPAGTGVDPRVGAGMIQLEPLVVPPISGGAGDRFEPNESSDQPSAFGPLTGTQSYANLSIGQHTDGLPDYDWFHWTAGTAGLFLASIDVGAGSGGLELWLFTVSGNTLVRLGQSSATGDETANVSAFVSAGQTILVEVKGRNSSLGVIDQGTFDLTVSLG